MGRGSHCQAPQGRSAVAAKERVGVREATRGSSPFTYLGSVEAKWRKVCLTDRFDSSCMEPPSGTDCGTRSSAISMLGDRDSISQGGS